MRRSALAYLACPGCAGDLVLGSIGSEDDQHVMDGQLVCAGCASHYQIRDGVPLLVTSHVDPVKTETAARFAEEWTRWTDLRDYYEKQFLGWVAPVTRA